MVELLRTEDFVLLSALKAALAEAGIDAVEFDGPVADIYGALFPRRLMVLGADLWMARKVAASLAPELFPQA